MIYHGDTEARSKLLHEELTRKSIGAAIEVHRAFSPGLLESAYAECLCPEFNPLGLPFQPQDIGKGRYRQKGSMKLFGFSVPLCLRGND